MVHVLGFVVQSLGLFAAAKLLKVNLNIITAAIVILVGSIVSVVFPEDLIGFILGMLVFFICVKLFDKNCGLFEFVGLIVISLIVQYIILDKIIFPLIVNSGNTAILING